MSDLPSNSLKDHIAPHGGELRQLLVSGAKAEALKIESEQYPSLTLNPRQLCDLELLMNGGFSPLEGFMDQSNYRSVLSGSRLTGGDLWPIPVVLDISQQLADTLSTGDKLALRDAEGFMLAVLTLSDIWVPDKREEAELVYGTDDSAHPGVAYLYEETESVYLGGSIEGLQAPGHYDFEALWNSPTELRERFAKNGWRKVMAFQTSKPMHRLHREITLAAALEHGTHLLLHPTVGAPRPGDIPYHARVHCYMAVQQHYPKHLTKLSLLPLAIRMAGPRDALLSCIVHQNYGCSHYMVGPNEGAPPSLEQNRNWYGVTEAQELVNSHKGELQIQVIAVEAHGYSPSKDCFEPLSLLKLTAREEERFDESSVKQSLSQGADVPSWVSYPDVIEQLQKVYLPRERMGFTLFFTGLSGAGKSTLAKIVYAKLIEEGSRPVTLLDGDVVRLNLSSELGFSKEHRDLNIRRIGFVANEISKNGGVAICAPIAPYAESRRAVRNLVEQHGDFIEIFAATPLETCEARDRKGLYAKARKGIIKEFTGISDPYEAPEQAEIVIDTTGYTPMEAAQEIFLYLLKEGYLSCGE